MVARFARLIALLTVVVPLAAIAVAGSAHAASTLPPAKIHYVARAANGIGVPYPTTRETYPVTDGDKTVQVPENMCYVPSGDFTCGSGEAATTVHLDSYCIGMFDVTNAEYKAYLDANPQVKAPGYWVNKTFPSRKANHPVVEVSLSDANAYCDWISRETGRQIAIPTSQQWEKAARGPHAWLYPWGNTADAGYQGGIVVTKFNFNAVTVSEYLTKHAKQQVTYNDPQSPYFGRKTTVDRIAAYDASGVPTYLSIGAGASVHGWANPVTRTGFIYTDLFASLKLVGGGTTPIGTYEAGRTACGCYDMAGEVWNWCNTQIVATNGVERGKTVNEIRGGSWYTVADSCVSVSTGEGRDPGQVYNTVGFRIVMIPAKQ